MFVAHIPPASNGFTFAVKDNIDIVGMVSGMGSAAFADAPKASQTAQVVDRLIAADFQLVGKLVMHELAFGMTGVNDISGTPKNIIYPKLIPGGSSSGCAAAVAEGMVDVAIGTDTGGSIRFPAACCGVVGFKPTFKRLSRHGISPKISSLDCVGPIARNVHLIEQAMQAMDDSFLVSRDVQQIKLGVLTVDCATSVAKVFDKVVESTFSIDGVSHTELSLPTMGQAYEAGMVLIAKEAQTAFGHLPLEKLGADVGQRLSAAQAITDEEVARAQAIQHTFQKEVSAVFVDVDVIVLPTLPSKPLSLKDAERGAVDLGASSLVRPFNVSGHPAITLPVGRDEPFGLQLIGALNKDEELCAIAKRIERVLPKPAYSEAV